jgi:hypothetical protein
MLLYHGPQITLLRSDTTNASTLGSTPCQMELRKGGCRLYSYHITTDPTEDLTPLPGTGSNNKTPLSILRTAAGRGHNKKVVMHSLAVWFSLARVLCTKNNISGKCAFVIFNLFSFLGVLWLGSFIHCYAFQLSFLRRLNLFLEGAVEVSCVGRGWILMHVRTIVWVGGTWVF